MKTKHIINSPFENTIHIASLKTLLHSVVCIAVQRISHQMYNEAAAWPGPGTLILN